MQKTLEACDYDPVPNNDATEECDDNDKIPKIYFLRQLFISSGAWTMFFLCGMYLGAPTAFILQKRKEANSTEVISTEMASWLASISSYGIMPWSCILPIFLFYLGRKITATIAHFTLIIVSIIFYFSDTPIQLLVFELLQGLPHAGILTTTVLIIAEYTSPKNRGLFLAFKSGSLYWGIWISNAIAAFSYWRYIPIIGFICSLYTATVVFWPESPFWLASKGKFEECKAAHRWLRGTDRAAERELEKLIESQKIDVKEKVVFKNFIKHFFKTIMSKDFYRPVLVGCLTIAVYLCSGKIVYSINAIEVLRKITGNETAAYMGMLILDAVTVLSMYLGTYLFKIMKRRPFLLITAIGSTSFLFIISLYLFLVRLGVVSENMYVTIALLIAFSLFVSCGPTVMAMCVYGELLPINHKSFAVAIIAFEFALLQSSVLKISPYLFKTIQMDGTFLFYGVIMSIFIFLIYKYLPETKDMTLQEIGECFSDAGKKEKDVEENNELITRNYGQLTPEVIIKNASCKL